MSRPTKQGIDYFPIDVQFDEKIELLISELGSDALSTLVTIWQLAYQNNGYYVENGKDLQLLIRRRIMLDLDTIEKVINVCLERGIFNQTLHEKYNILTSKAIQKRYFIASRLKKKINIVKNYLLVDINDVGNATWVGVNDVGNATNVEVEVEVDVKGKVKEEANKIDFDTFWDLYDKKVGDKTKLQKKWDKLSLEIQTKALEHIKEYKQAQQDKQYRKNPDTYLNNKSWNDEIISSDKSSVTEFKEDYMNPLLKQFMEIDKKNELEESGIRKANS